MKSVQNAGVTRDELKQLKYAMVLPDAVPNVAVLVPVAPAATCRTSATASVKSNTPLLNVEVSRVVMPAGGVNEPVLRKLIDKLNKRFRTKLSVVAVANGYFGGDVSGLS